MSSNKETKDYKYKDTSDHLKDWAPLIVVIVGLVGLYFKVDYSGWVLFVGLVGML